MRRSDIIGIVLVLVWLGIFLAKPIDLVTSDLGRHITNGEILLHAPLAEKFAVLHTNFYSYTMGSAPFENHHWASGIVFYLVYTVAGFTGLSVINILLEMLAVGIVLSIAKQRSTLIFATFFTLVLTPIIASRSEVRPETFTYLLSAIFLWILARKKHLWLIPILTLIWVNLHIGFVFGFLFLGAFGLEELIKLLRKQESRFASILYVSLASLVAGLINPFGYKALLYPFIIFRNYGYRLVENQSVSFLENLSLTNGEHFLLFKLVLLVLTVLFLAKLFIDKKIDIAYSVLMLVLGTMA